MASNMPNSMAHPRVFGEADAHSLASRADEQLVAVGPTGEHARQAHLRPSSSVSEWAHQAALALDPRTLLQHWDQRRCADPT